MIESLLSLFIMSVGLMTIVAVISGSLRTLYVERDLIIATELAQEGVELVRNVRDTDVVAGNDGFSDFDDGRHCRIDWNDASGDLDCQNSKGGSSRYALNYSNEVYAHGSGATGRYTRYIHIDYNGGGNQRAMVRSFVFWGTFLLGDIPNSGNPANCLASPSCVYTESLLTAWRTP